MEIQGNCHEDFLEVKNLFQELHDSGRETGSSFAVYRDGEPLVDIWGGYIDNERKTIVVKNIEEISSLWFLIFLVFLMR